MMEWFFFGGGWGLTSAEILNIFNNAKGPTRMKVKTLNSVA